MITVGEGVDLHVREEGNGAPVVLLHGHTLDLTVWDEVAPWLLAAGYRVIRYDQRGHGRSSSPPAGYRYGDHAADLAALLARLDAAPAHLVGLSKGAGIALEFTLRHPEQVRSLALVGPLVPDYPLGEALVGSFRELARAIRSAGVQPALRRHWLSHPLIASAAAIPAVRERLEAMLHGFPAGEYFASSRDEPDRSWRVTDRLGEIAVPVLVVRGEHEVPEFVSMAALLAERLPRCTVTAVPGSGHLVPLEKPRAVAEHLLGFLPHLG